MIMKLFTREDYMFYPFWNKVGNEKDIIVDLEDRLQEGTDNHIQDIIMDVAGANVEIYTKELWDLAPAISDWIKEGLSEFDIGRDSSLEQLFEYGQYLYNTELLNGNIDYAIHNLACDILEDLIEEEVTSGKKLSDTDRELLDENINEYLSFRDIDYKSDVIESMENLLEDYKNGDIWIR